MDVAGYRCEKGKDVLDSRKKHIFWFNDETPPRPYHARRHEREILLQ